MFRAAKAQGTFWEGGQTEGPLISEGVNLVGGVGETPGGRVGPGGQHLAEALGVVWVARAWLSLAAAVLGQWPLGLRKTAPRSPLQCPPTPPPPPRCEGISVPEGALPGPLLP